MPATESSELNKILTAVILSHSGIFFSLSAYVLLLFDSLDGGISLDKKIIKKPLNLHRFSMKLNNFIPDWKFITPVIFSVAGIIFGSLTAKGERGIYLKLSELISRYILSETSITLHENFMIHLLLPTIFVVIIFFSGLSVYGCFAVNTIPLLYSFFASMIVYFLFDTYALKGLAYVAIMIIPYCILSLFSLITITGESISMSQLLIKTLGKSKRLNDYNFVTYYKNSLKYYLFIILAVAVRIIMHKLFSSIFIF